MTDSFDPTTVPPFPVVTLDLRADGAVIVDGRPITPAPGEDSTSAGVAAVAQYARANNLPAVRVRATSPAGEHPMVVTIDGTPYDLSDPAPTDTKRSYRALVITGIAVVLGGGLVLGSVVAYNATTSAPVAVATTKPKPPGYHSNVPVLAPPGYAQTADWAVKVDSNTAPVLLDSRRIVIVDSSGNLALLNTKDGSTLWRGSHAPAGQDGIHLVHVAGTSMIAGDSGGTLSLWPIELDRKTRTPSYDLNIGSNATVNYDGSAPLAILGDQTAATVTADGKAARVDIPVTATPLMATADEVIAGNADTWWSIDSRNKAQSHTMPRPSDTKGEPTTLVALDDTHLFAVWPTGDNQHNVATVVDLTTNTIVAQKDLDTSDTNSQSRPIHAPVGNTAAVGNVFIDYGTKPTISVVEDLTPEVVAGTTVYGTGNGNAPMYATLRDGSFTAKPFTELTVDDRTLPNAVSDDRAFLVAEKVEDTYLYAVPRDEGATE